jgi:hypothetical protein
MPFFVEDPITGVTRNTFDVSANFADVEALAWLDACGNPDPGGGGSLIQNVTVDKNPVCLGDELTVSVVATHPDGPPNTVEVQVNGAAGATQFFNFAGLPGPHQIAVTATTLDGYTDSRLITVNVVTCSGSSPKPRIRIGPNPYHHNTVDLTVSNAADYSPRPTAYDWTFGDGTTQTTTSPYATHDFSHAFAFDVPYAYLTASVAAHTARGQLVSHKTVGLPSRYFAERQRGILQPPAHEGALSVSASGASATYTLFNPEAQSLTLSAKQLEYQPCDPAQTTTYGPVLTTSVVMPPDTETQFNTDLGAVASGVCGVGLHLRGQGMRGRVVEVDLYYNVDRAANSNTITSASWIAELNAAAAAKSLSATDPVTEEDLYTLALTGQIPPWPSGELGLAPIVAPSCPLDQEPVQGAACDPHCPVLRDGWECDPSPDWVQDAPFIANGLKGDSILSPGCGKIGSLLHVLGQHQSHMGIMVDDRYTIANSTAEEDLLTKSQALVPDSGLFAGDDGFAERYLRWLWPGAITQTIEQAFLTGTHVQDPSGWVDDSNNPIYYDLRPFNANAVLCDGDTELQFPRVLKVGLTSPLPTNMAGAADNAKMAAENQAFHYRSFNYTKGDTATQANASNYLGRQDSLLPNSRPSMCASFVWQMEQDTGGPAIATDDVAAYASGRERLPSTPPGFFFYSEQKRSLAALVLWSGTYSAVLAKPWAAQGGAPENYANEVVNCFAFDRCAPNDTSRTWQTDGVGTGETVSPDDMEYWTVYRHQEDLALRVMVARHAYSWQPATGTGGIEGTVYDPSNNPVADAHVYLDLTNPDGTDVSTQTDSRGHYKFVALRAPATRVVTATAEINGAILTGTADSVAVATGQTTTADIQLGLDRTRREIALSMTFHIDSRGDNATSMQTRTLDMQLAGPMGMPPAITFVELGDTFDTLISACEDSPKESGSIFASSNAIAKLHTDLSVSMDFELLLQEYGTRFSPGCRNVSDNYNSCLSDPSSNGCPSNFDDQQTHLDIPEDGTSSTMVHLQNNDNSIWTDVTISATNLRRP